jgi:hypothetical protein
MRNSLAPTLRRPHTGAIVRAALAGLAGLLLFLAGFLALSEANKPLPPRCQSTAHCGSAKHQHQLPREARVIPGAIFFASNAK